MVKLPPSHILPLLPSVEKKNLFQGSCGFRFNPFICSSSKVSQSCLCSRMTDPAPPGAVPCAVEGVSTHCVSALSTPEAPSPPPKLLRPKHPQTLPDVRWGANAPSTLPPLPTENCHHEQHGKVDGMSMLGKRSWFPHPGFAFWFSSQTLYIFYSLYLYP